MKPLDPRHLKLDFFQHVCLPLLCCILGEVTKLLILWCGSYPVHWFFSMSSAFSYPLLTSISSPKAPLNLFHLFPLRNYFFKLVQISLSFITIYHKRHLRFWCRQPWPVRLICRAIQHCRVLPYADLTFSTWRGSFRHCFRLNRIVQCWSLVPATERNSRSGSWDDTVGVHLHFQSSEPKGLNKSALSKSAKFYACS